MKKIKSIAGMLLVFLIMGINDFEIENPHRYSWEILLSHDRGGDTAKAEVPIGKTTPPRSLSELLQIGEKAERLEKIMLENGITNEMALVCMLATAKHESNFNSQTVFYEKNGTVSRGVFQFNSRGEGRGVSTEKLHSKSYQVKHLVSKPYFRQWYGEVKTKNWSIETAMTELTKRVIKCAPKHYPPRIKTASKWWKEIKQIRR